MAGGAQPCPFGPDDDRFHDVGERWWATETAWFSFFHPDRSLGGWVYLLFRPNIGTVQGGVWVWDGTAFLPWEVPYSANYSSIRIEEGTDLADASLRNGVTLRRVKPLTVYDLGYDDAPRLTLRLRFESVMEPAPYGHGKPPFLAASHFDQLGRVTGAVRLHGQTIPIDCISMRDRSWGPRPETRMRRLSYNFATASAGHALFATTNPALADDPVDHGWLIRDGRLALVAEASRRVERHPRHGYVTAARIDGHDELGRRFRLRGEAVSRIVLNRHTAITWSSLMRWDLDGDAAWGEDQDMWPVHDWSAFRRAQGAHS
ncbi:MAG: DUF7065 domain-containing protein [Acidimicrobiia bacterium]